MKSKIKICGLSRMEDIEAVNLYLPDYIGFVFAKSRRQIDLKRAEVLKNKLDPQIEAVGIFVNHPVDEVVEIIKSGAINIVQLHGDETDEYIRDLKDKLPSEKNLIIKAIRVKSKPILQTDNLVDYYLFDTYVESHYGGAGIGFNWELIKDIDKPYFLAGGIQLSNVEVAIKQLHPYCIDLSSGVERDGLKDTEKIKEIVEKVRRIK
ncbi:phosphoribosylanthranilate isomerase [Eubacteriaceae bacterium ES3]|nr:phosphoribosylanthranilate isomerase [Eubacteriaceae bacterium ES3]